MRTNRRERKKQKEKENKKNEKWSDNDEEGNMDGTRERRGGFEKLNWTLTKERGVRQWIVRLDVRKWSLSCVVIDSSRLCFARIGQFPIAKDGHKTAMFFFTLPSLRFFLPVPVVRLFFPRFKSFVRMFEKHNVDRIVASFRYSNSARFLENSDVDGRKELLRSQFFNERNNCIEYGTSYL